MFRSYNLFVTFKRCRTKIKSVLRLAKFRQRLYDSIVAFKVYRFDLLTKITHDGFKSSISCDSH